MNQIDFEKGLIEYISNRLYEPEKYNFVIANIIDNGLSGVIEFDYHNSIHTYKIRIGLKNIIQLNYPECITNTNDIKKILNYYRYIGDKVVEDLGVW